MQKVLTRIVDAVQILTFEAELDKLVSDGKWRLMRLDVTPLPWDGKRGQDALMSPTEAKAKAMMTLVPPVVAISAVLEDQSAAQKALLQRAQELGAAGRATKGPAGPSGPVGHACPSGPPGAQGSPGQR